MRVGRSCPEHCNQLHTGLLTPSEVLCNVSMMDVLASNMPAAAGLQVWERVTSRRAAVDRV